MRQILQLILCTVAYTFSYRICCFARSAKPNSQRISLVLVVQHGNVTFDSHNQTKIPSKKMSLPLPLFLYLPFCLNDCKSTALQFHSRNHSVKIRGYWFSLRPKTVSLIKRLIAFVAVAKITTIILTSRSITDMRA